MNSRGQEHQEQQLLCYFTFFIHHSKVATKIIPIGNLHKD